MHPSDTGSSSAPADPIAAAFRARRQDVMAEWENRVLADIPVSARLGRPILVDTLPIFYENIADALFCNTTRTAVTSGTNLAMAHGRERANLTDYGPQDVIHELQLFRDVVFKMAHDNAIELDKDQAEIIGHSIEEAIRESMVGYASANREINELFIASLSHDLRNPLHVANASAQLIQRGNDNPATVRLAKRIIKKLGETDAMIETLLDAAVLKGRMRLKLHLTHFDILDLVQEVCVDLPVLGQPVRIVGDPLAGWWCRVSMKRALENLVSNARKYGTAHGPITASVAGSDDRMFLSIHNEGPTIPAEQVKRLFGTFERLENVDVKGWGLGLPFVQNVAESHGGSVVVDSVEGRGTTFTLSMPVDARPFVNLRRSTDALRP